MRDDALALSELWRAGLSVNRVVAAGLQGITSAGSVDLVAIGKAASAMDAAARAALGTRVSRRFVVVPEVEVVPDPAVRSGEHPRPGPASARAGRDLITFLADSAAETTVFLVSGGASSLCVAPEPPVTVADLGTFFDLSLSEGWDITTLNQLRAATSALGGGAVLAHCRSDHTRALVMVDNVVSGAPWVASGLTYPYWPDATALAALAHLVGTRDRALGRRVRRSGANRAGTLGAAARPAHANVVVAEPADVLAVTVAGAERLGYGVDSLGAAVSGDAAAVADQIAAAVTAAATRPGPTCVVGVGEVTTVVAPGGSGGRCQHLAALVARSLAGLVSPATFVARATDGRDYVSGCAGAWVDENTMARAPTHGLDWTRAIAACATHGAHGSLGQLLAGGPTGWNLCDLYVACVAGA